LPTNTLIGELDTCSCKEFHTNNGAPSSLGRSAPSVCHSTGWRFCWCTPCLCPSAIATARIILAHFPIRGKCPACSPQAGRPAPPRRPGRPAPAAHRGAGGPRPHRGRAVRAAALGAVATRPEPPGFRAGGTGHGLEASGVAAFLTGVHPAKAGAFYKQTVEEREAFLAQAYQQLLQHRRAPYA